MSVRMVHIAMAPVAVLCITAWQQESAREWGAAVSDDCMGVEGVAPEREAAAEVTVS